MIYQIYYNDDQLSKLYPFAIPHYNEGLTIFFENSVIAPLVLSADSSWVSVCSWKLHEKVRRAFPVTLEKLNGTYEVLSFSRKSKKHTPLAMARQWHEGFQPAIEKLFEKMGLKLPGEAKNSIYQNHYSAQTAIYKRYVNEFLIPAMELIEKDEELNKLMMVDSHYGKLSKQADLKSVKEKLGLNYYPMAPFVLERCPQLWYSMNGFKIEYL